MLKCRQCDRRILLERRLPIEVLVSLDALREEFARQQFDQLREDLLKSAQPEVAERASVSALAPFATCVALLALSLDLGLYVADPERDFGYQIRPDVINGDCCSWSIWEAAEKHRFITKPSEMRHGSLEIRLDGQPIYVLGAEAKRLFRLRPTAPRALRAIVDDVIRRAEKEGRTLTCKQLRDEVKRHPGVRSVSDRQIDEIAREIKPASWKKPGRRPTVKR